MSADNNFKTSLESLFRGMDGFLTSKTVVGDAITVGDTIILPLVDVTFGVGAGTSSADKKNNSGGGMGGKITPSATSSSRTAHQAGEHQESGFRDQDPGHGAGFR